eukprot:10896059-Alexandrium_andersonii.AAC.1
MSASLVGSEMCIRDSCGRWPLTNLNKSVLYKECLDTCQGPFEVAIHQIPVSYTHLTLPTICSV